jgi:hypothetical protein
MLIDNYRISDTFINVDFVLIVQENNQKKNDPRNYADSVMELQSILSKKNGHSDTRLGKMCREKSQAVGSFISR